ncbi:E3 ubiquitin-protein ligase [Salix suchowensis]|nr:E3 ubiquitin-protein ligase [Salix suchowensis]
MVQKSEKSSPQTSYSIQNYPQMEQMSYEEHSTHNPMCFELNYLFLAKLKNNGFFLNLVQDTQFVKLIITHQISFNYPSNPSKILIFHSRDQSVIFQSARSFNRKSLHHLGNGQNPYEQAISIIGRTLSAFDEDNLIPCYGFGDASTHDQDVFSFFPDERFCNGFEEVLLQYKEIVPNLRLAGPTSFAPVIEMAITIVEQSGGQYHVLLIIADGQVTRNADTRHGQLSPQERRTIDAIVRASEYPLSIILVGVGDGPWEMMREFDDNIPARAFDNFQFVNFTEIMSKNIYESRKETEFALASLMEIPSQHKATIELGLLGHQRGISPLRVPLPPPIYGPHSSIRSKASRSSSFQQRSPSYSGYDTPVSGYETPSGKDPSSSSVYDSQVCAVCLTNPKNMAFGCGHQTCCDCGEDLELCPICRRPIHTRIKLY